MCGIVGAVGKLNIREFLLSGLATLDYRGYDSAGTAFATPLGMKIYKVVGSVAELAKKVPDEVDAFAGIGHTRWATHGVPSLKNCHPVTSTSGKVTLVHNGVIENFMDLKTSLLKEGYRFQGDTDSEVIACLIDLNIKRYQSVKKAIAKSMKLLQGSFACAVMVKGEEGKIYALKRSSPMLLGEAEGFSLLASDAVPLISHTNRIIELSDNQIAEISAYGVRIFDSELDEIAKEYVQKDPELLKRDLGGYPHYMLKEIEEIETVVRRLKLTYYHDGEYQFNKDLLHEIEATDEVIFIACGTSYHASLIGARYLRTAGKSASSYIASEWAYYPQLPSNKPFAILISQSGETADLIHCLKILKQHDVKTLIITNTKGSTLERGCDYSILLNAGLEVSVASTKAYAAQVAVLALLEGALTKKREVIQDIEDCCATISYIQNECKGRIMEMAEELKGSKDIFYLGRGFDYDLSLEASLKLKEVSYIHSEAVPGGELKHGPIALIEKGTPVIVFVTDEVTSTGMRGNIQEIKARGAKVYVVATKKLAAPGDAFVLSGFDSRYSAIAISSIAFYFAYYVSVYKGLNVDKPRNLAKSVTVE